MDTSNIFEEKENKELIDNETIIPIVDEKLVQKGDSSQGKVSISNIFVHFIFVSLIIILCVAFPFLWMSAGFSGSSFGIIIAFGNLIAIAVLTFMYSRWKKSFEQTANSASIAKTKKVFTIIFAVIVCVIIIFVYYQSVK